MWSNRKHPQPCLSSVRYICILVKYIQMQNCGGKTQISRAINSAISERIIPEIQNMMGSSTLVQQGVEPNSSLNGDEIGNMWKNTKLTKKDSRSACDLRDHTDTIPYTYICNFTYNLKHCFLTISYRIPYGSVRFHAGKKYQNIE